jgi:hypothetical protein
MPEDLRIGQTPRSIPSGNRLHTDIPFHISPASFDHSPTPGDHFVLSGTSHTGSQDPSSESRQSIDLTTSDHSSASRHSHSDLPWNPLIVQSSSGFAPLANSRNTATPNKPFPHYRSYSGSGTFHDSAIGTQSRYSQDESSSMTSGFEDMDNMKSYLSLNPPQPEEVYPASDQIDPQLEAVTQPTAQSSRPKRQPKSQRQTKSKEDLLCPHCGTAQKTPSDLKYVPHLCSL